MPHMQEVVEDYLTSGQGRFIMGVGSICMTEVVSSHAAEGTKNIVSGRGVGVRSGQIGRNEAINTRVLSEGGEFI
jgi:hypothetical protein